MKIYPDPELPDIVVEWDTYDCMEGIEEVHITVYPEGGTEPIADTTVPCSAQSVRFDDVARERYRVEGTLTTSDEVFTAQGVEADLRDGVNERAYVYFDTFSNIRVAWTFEPGSSCASLGAPWIAIDVGTVGSETFDFTNHSPCELSPYTNRFPEDVALRIRVRAHTRTATLAVAPVEEVLLGTGTVDLSVVLAPCGANCPTDTSDGDLPAQRDARQ
jgi:hypothetical protein